MYGLRRLAWFLLKSPQRKVVGWNTLLVDLQGAFSWFLHQFLPRKKEPIWICTGVWNRSETLLQNLIPSMNRVAEKHLLALSIADCSSTDIAELEAEVRKIWKGELVFSTQNENFSRSAAFNRAILQAGECLFICDADISIPENIVARWHKQVSKKTAWFPLCQWQIHEHSPEWKWFSAGTGLFGATKSQLQLTGLYDQEITDWGKEDWDLFFRFYRIGIMPLRNREPGLYHHWHKPTKPANYVNLF